MKLSKRESTQNRVVFGLIVLLFLVYAVCFIYRSSFILKGERYYSLHDDMMISMRYAKNLVNGHGLVWNPGGERVEGYTNPLWTLYMALFHLFPIPASKISLFIQLSGVMILILNLYVVKQVARLISDDSALISMGAVFLTALYLPMNKWSLQGMEVGLLTLIVSMSLGLALKCLMQNKFDIKLYLLLGVGIFVRPDMVVPFLFIAIFLIAADPLNRKDNLLYAALILFGAVFFQTGLRYWYYGEILPNTYYLKLSGYPLFLRMTRGLNVFGKFAWNMNVLLFLLPLFLLFYRREKNNWLLAWVFLGQILYSIYVGGDAWENRGGSNRYLSIVMPCFFIMFSLALSQFVQVIISKLKKVESEKVLQRASFKYVVVFLLMLSQVSFNRTHGGEPLADYLLLRPSLVTWENQMMVERALLVKEITTPQAKVAVVWAGTLPYFADRFAIDMLGKNDKRIAHQKIKIPAGKNKYTAFYPGHMKYNYDYSIGELKPDIVVKLWGVTQAARPYLKRYYKKDVFYRKIFLYLKKGSPFVMKEKAV